ncbi:MAG TPA: sulfurtransferase-like selenium metabolism protein YedF [Candidatus Krumholzibacteria bacterium]|nr:sulfurtransferase-like selenium metabolism protein YedF [Candidatus Krumholzibacteria bacterium]
MSAPTNTVVFIGSDALGRGDEELGRALMLSALKMLPKLPGEAPSHVLFMNAGVRFCCRGSAALKDLEELAAAGTQLLCCGTCLDWLEVMDMLKVGRVSNMAEILETMHTAGRVMRL